MSAGVILWRNPDRCVGPDVSFVSKSKLPVQTSPEEYLETIPDLIVEVCSRHDTTAYLKRKAADYLQAGVLLVWIVDPASNTVIEHRPGISPKTLGSVDTLQCDDIIPGFRLPLTELFKD